MVETVNLIISQLDYQPHCPKSHLTYWYTALSVKLFGKNEFAVRFPNTVVFVLLMFIVWKLGSFILDDKAVLVSAFIYILSLFPVVAVNSVSTDLLLSSWEALSVLICWWAYRSDNTNAQKRLIIFI